MTEIEFPIDKSSQGQDAFADIQNDDLDTPVFLLKMPKKDLQALSEPLI
jgi:hypothetical protein